VYFLVQVLQAGAIGAPIEETVKGFTWIPGDPATGEGAIGFALLIDNLSALLLVLVSFLSMLIAIYSIGYMREESGKPRYYAEIALFVAGMLGTVSADNFLQLLIFWEIMGLCSYLLIGFWYHKPEAASAAKKAFLVTRVGDVLFLVGILVIWNLFHTFRFEEIVDKIPALWGGVLTPQLMVLIPLLLFGGAVGKSAQFPLHAWLPDAMEGPATVSALIHAATMVKAGVYLTARSFIFLVPLDATGHILVQAVPWVAILVVAGIGAFTALFSASMALANYDIKRVLAFSTISQLAYMFLGLGAGAYLMASEASRGNAEIATAGYSAALFHLTNHAFFKALLFLAAGSLIHAVHTNDLREMGGLGKVMPWTSRTMLMGSLALAGIIPFSGFFSKDEILSVTFEVGAANPLFYLMWVAGIATAFMTAFYAFRMWLLAFHGGNRGLGHPHESPRVMTSVLLVLSMFTIASGMFAYLTNGFSNLIFYEDPHAALPLVTAAVNGNLLELALAGLSLGLALAGIGLAWTVYAKQRIPAATFTRTPTRAYLHSMLLNRYWIDDYYNAFGSRAVAGFARLVDWFDRNIVDGIVNAVGRGGVMTAFHADRFDRNVIDGLVNGISLETVRSSVFLRTKQTGQVQSYTWVIVVGIIAILLLALFLGFLPRALGGP
jgi:NADH-quinone oxidoreductase subunit L